MDSDTPVGRGPGNGLPSLGEMWRRLWSGPAQSRAARTVELYGWALMLQGGAIVLFPAEIAALLHFAPLQEQAENFLRLIGLLAGGVGLLYTISGRLNAEGFVFATLIDRPLVPPAAALLWYLDIMPSGFALLFALEDFGTWLWTLSAWRAEMRS